MHKTLGEVAVELSARLKESLETIHPHPEFRGEWMRVSRFKVESLIETCNRQLAEFGTALDRGCETDCIVSISLAQGMLEALRRLGLADFHWKVYDERP